MTAASRNQLAIVCAFAIAVFLTALTVRSCAEPVPAQEVGR